MLRGDGWPSVNPIVDCYLANQVSELIPHGGYDVERLSGCVRLSLSPGGERFEPLGGGEEWTSAGEVVYRDEARILTRRWNYRDCDAAKITTATTKFMLMMESPSPNLPASVVEAAVDALVSRYRACCNGEFTYVIIRPDAVPRLVV